MKNPRIVLPLSIALLVTIWMLSGVFFNNASSETGDAQATELTTKPLQKVLIDLAHNQRIHQILTVQGEVMPIRRVEVKAETRGKVAEILVRRGQTVQANQLILRLDEDERQVKFLQAQSEQKSAYLDYRASEKLVAQGANSKTEFESAKARLSRVEAELEAARLELKRIEVRAPFAGIIENTPPELGQLIGVGESLVTIADTHPIIVKAAVPQTEMSQIRIATIGTAYLLTGETIKGKIHNIAPSARNASRTFEIEFALEGSETIPPLGVSASLVLELAEVDAVEISPAILSQNNQGDLIIKSVTPDNRVQYLPITRIKTTAGNLWVAGIADGTQIITRGAGFVAENEQVEAISQIQVDVISQQQKDLP